MRIIEPSVQILTTLNPSLLITIERAGRTCYKSEREFTEDTASKFVRMLISRGHESVLEHETVTVKFICDRGVSHEIVRHRIAAYSQESTRFCNYSQDKFGNELTFIKPFFFEPCECCTPQSFTDASRSSCACQSCLNYNLWHLALEQAERSYLGLLRAGIKPEEARSVLPNSLKTEIVCTFNLREWRHFFKLRAQGVTGPPHPQMREIVLPLYHEFLTQVPALVEDIVIPEECYNGILFAEVYYNTME